MSRKKSERQLFEEFVVQVRYHLKTDVSLLMAAVKCLWRYQTEKEKMEKDSCEQNGMGFNKPDAKALSWLAIELEKNLEPWDWRVSDAAARVPKYAKQIAYAMLKGNKPRIQELYGIEVPNLNLKEINYY